MKRPFQRFFLFAFILLVGNNCIDPISFPLNSTDSKVVVYGQLTDVDEPQYVIVQKSSINRNDPSPIKNAIVTLLDETGGRYSYIQEKPGKYRLIGLSRGIPGIAYSIEVSVNGINYKSDLERIPESVGTDSLYYKISEESFISKDASQYYHLLSVYAKSTLPPSKNLFFRWETDEAYFMALTFFPNGFNTPPPDCFASDRVDAQRINLLDGSKVKTQIIQQLVAEREIDYTFKSRHYIIVRQLSTTKESYTYWGTIKTLLNNTGSPFDIPPALIQGNIRNIDNEKESVLGYFEACRVSSSRFFLVPGFIPYYLKPYCEYDPNYKYQYPSVCVDCSKSPNGSGERPSWF